MTLPHPAPTLPSGLFRNGVHTMMNLDPAVVAYYKALLQEHYEFWSMGVHSVRHAIEQRTGQFGYHFLAEHVKGGLLHIKYEKQLQQARRIRWRSMRRCLVHAPPALYLPDIPDEGEFPGKRPLTEAQKEAQRKRRTPNAFMLQACSLPRSACPL